MDRFSFLLFDKEEYFENSVGIIHSLASPLPLSVLLFPFSFQVDALVTQLELQTCRTVLGVLKDTVECQIQNFFIFYSPGTGFEGLRILLRIERFFVFFICCSLHFKIKGILMACFFILLLLTFLTN